MTLTVEQRRMVVEYMATKCVEEMPSEDMPKAEFFRDLHSEEWRLQTMKAIEKVIPEDVWEALIESLENYQSFDRNPQAFIYERGFSESTSPANLREYLNDDASGFINEAARY
jgi:hypothetical protein